MRGRFLDRQSRKQFRHPLPPARATAAAPIVPRHHRARVTPPPPLLLKGHVHRQPVRGLGQTARPVVPGSRRIHQPPPCPDLYRGGSRHGWINQQTQPKPLARRHRSNWAHGAAGESAGLVRATSQPGKKGTSHSTGHKAAPFPSAQTGAARAPRRRVVHTPAPVAGLVGASRRGRVPAEVIPFVRWHGRRVQNPQARPAPAPGAVRRPGAPVAPPITNLTSIPVERGHRQARPRTGPPSAGMCRRGRVPAPTAPFLLREGRRLRGTRPLPAPGQARRGRVPLVAQTARVLVRRRRLCRLVLSAPSLLAGHSWRSPLWHTGLSAQVVVFPCDVVPLRPEADDGCAPRADEAEIPVGRPESQEGCPPRPPACPNER